MSEPARLPVCDAAALAPAWLTPALMASLAFFTFMAASMNFLPSLRPSIYMAMVQVCGSSSKNFGRSASDTSALLPVLTTQLRPSLEPMAQSTKERPSAPLWLIKDISPLGGILGIILAFREMLLFTKPIVLGPSILMS